MRYHDGQTAFDMVRYGKLHFVLVLVLLVCRYIIIFGFEGITVANFVDDASFAPQLPRLD